VRFALGLSFLSAVGDRFWLLGILWRASCRVGNFRQIRDLDRTAQLVLTERDDYDPSHRLHLRRNHSRFSAAVGMADADRGSVKWSAASIVSQFRWQELWGLRLLWTTQYSPRVAESFY
jgi:hypothetical protein